MSLILAHITHNEFPAGLAMFVAGLVLGVALAAAYFSYFRARD
jgi:hypothetical protein